MLKLKNITKEYKMGDERIKALKGIDLEFRESEFVSILGPSGCGKTTLLNIIGGLDRYTSGDLIINGKSTKKFKDRDWDSYRNYKVGFIFQTYNLIGHQTVLSNVELALTIGGVSKKERRERAIKALEDVGLKEHIHKRPSQLSGGQMQRVAIARALVNDPDIILADEPTGALDTKTSIQIMEILKKIAKNKLIVMVTHNPELAEQYSTRIIRILDGLITEDSNPIKKDEKYNNKNSEKIGRASMKLWTAFRLSLNNLLTKKGRTILVAFAGSIGIIGIALIQSVSNGFQAYVDSIQEDTLTSYPLTIYEETSDIAGTLLSMMSEEETSGDGTIKEEQYISKILANLSTNDLRSFKNHMVENEDEIKNDLAATKYSYSVNPNIYAIDATEKLVKLNPSNLFKSTMSMSSPMMNSFTSIYSQMIDNKEIIDKSYDVIAGKLPENYDEMIIVLSDRNSISDLLVYSLGLRNTEELTNMVTKIMAGETVDINNEAKVFTAEDLMNTELRLIMPADTYKYNERYDVYEDMSKDEDYMQNLYNNALKLKIVGIVAPKEGVRTATLNPGVAYTSKLVDHIIDYSKNTDLVKRQLQNEEVDVLSGNRFDEKNKKSKLDFKDIISIDTDMLSSAFGMNIDQDKLQEETAGYMGEIASSISTDTSKAKNDFDSTLNTLAKGLLDTVDEDLKEDDIEKTVNNYLSKKEVTQEFSKLEKNYIVPKDVFKTTFKGLLQGMLQAYVKGLNMMSNIPSSLGSFGQMQNLPTEMGSIPSSSMPDLSSIGNIDIKDTVLKAYLESAPITETEDKMAQVMTEAVMKKTILEKVAELTTNLTGSIASSFNVDQSKISNAFKMKMTEDEITRVISAMITTTESTAKTNLINFGYQDKEEPTYISFYFTSFDGKEHFIDFINKYNDHVKEIGEDDKEINFSDTTGILMGSVKTIVNAVTYVLIAFVSISLIVSSIMIGIITYISVYERTKEIGILRAIGASKRNISSIFNAETFIIGLLSGLFGIGITYILVPIINVVLHNFTGNIPLNAVFYPENAIRLVVLSVILTLIGGIIPARAASKKDPAVVLRTE